LLIIIL